jgi:tight adherence protein B
MNEIMASHFFIYLSHLITGIGLGCVLYSFRNAIRRFLSRFRDKLSKDAVQQGKDRQDLFVAGGSGALAAVFLSMLLSIPFWVSVIIFITALFVLPQFLITYRAKKYREAFDKVLAESLMTVSSSLKAGLTLHDALLVAAGNSPEPFSREVSRCLREYKFGASTEEGMENLRNRIGTTDSKISFGALIIGSQLGGKLPQILQKIIKTIRERERVEGRLKALTAQGRSQAAILCAAPPLLGVGLYFYDPGKMSLMTDTLLGQVLLGLAIALEVIGLVVTMKVMKLDI